MTESTTEHSNEMNQDGRGSYAEVHGLKLYYEIHGEGFPLVLLHGGLSTIGTSFGKVLPGLARERQVIAIEQQAHGHTADSDRRLTYEQMANDTSLCSRTSGSSRPTSSAIALEAGSPCRLPSSIRRWCASWWSLRPSPLLTDSNQGFSRVWRPSNQ